MSDELEVHDATTWFELARNAFEAGDCARTAALARRAIERSGSEPAHYDLLGQALAAEGDVHAAIEEFRLASLLGPTAPEHHYNLGLALRSAGRRAEAIAALERAWELGPTFAAVRPVLAECWVELARSLIESGHDDRAEECLRNALDVAPGWAPAVAALGALLANRGQCDEARALVDDAIALDPSPRLRLFSALLLPPVVGSVAEIEASRAALAQALDDFHQTGTRVEAESLPTLFYLAYHGRDDRAIHESMGRAISPSPCSRRVARPVRRDARLRVGFASNHLREHTIGRLFGGLIARLDRAAFTVVVLSDKRHEDALGREIAASADEFVTYEGDLAAACERVAGCELDALVYTDLGMDNRTLSLAARRLAGVQCVTWGHPATSGLATIDYFVSSELLEIEQADAHYTERLVRLPTLPVYYSRPRIEGPRKSRGDFGLPEGAHLYGCPQTLFKLHPDFDVVLAAILRADAQGRLVLLRGRHAGWEEAVLVRLARTAPDILERIDWVAPQSRPDFLQLNEVVDVLLDPLHFGGGNTSYEALAVGTPIVTLPSAFLKGRITQALYRKMGVLDAIAATTDEYIEIALALGTDRERNRALRERILARSPTLFEDEEAPRAFQDFLLNACA